MRIQTLAIPELGNRGYVVDDGTTAIVIDPQRDLDRLEPLLDQQPSYVLETHIHNDYVTGGFELARRTGAAYGVNAADEVSFERLPLDEGQTLVAGSLEVTVLTTPGHTDTHLSYLVQDLTDPLGSPVLFSGGSLLYGTVGRTDLVSPDLTAALSTAQYRSAQRLSTLAPDTVLFPTHGFGSFCAAIGGTGVEASTIGHERRTNAALTARSEDEFVRELIASLTAYPAYYAHMAPLNRRGPSAIDPSAPLLTIDPAEVARRLAAGEPVVDLRAAEEFAHEHLAGSLSIALGAQFATYVGWLVPWGAPLTVVGSHRHELEEAIRHLGRIGIERTAVAWDALEALAPASVERRSYRRAHFTDLVAERADTDTVIDVRREDEYAAGHVPGARHLPLHQLQQRLEELPDARTWVYCAGGFRAGIAASILDRSGFEVIQVDDSFDSFGTQPERVR